ncbi:hypothetical protein BS50DRAFT_497280, partial [Corynespora cassiicola Philippines]
KIELPVRSAVLKLCTGGLVVRWVTTGESPLSYVFFCTRRVIYKLKTRHVCLNNYQHLETIYIAYKLYPG